MPLGSNTQFTVAGAQDAFRMQRMLGRLNRTRLTPHISPEQWSSTLDEEIELRRLEHQFVEREREEVRLWADSAPRTAEAFVQWFEELKQ
ncbi:MAG TPA: hypothetical protein VMF89_17745, partial [Polyangiales bacterium]|nr:hypothetical protein [Polyangiales bacterium]